MMSEPQALSTRNASGPAGITADYSRPLVHFEGNEWLAEGEPPYETLNRKASATQKNYRTTAFLFPAPALLLLV